MSIKERGTNEVERAKGSSAERSFVVDVIEWFKRDLGLDYKEIAESLEVEPRTLLSWRKEEIETLSRSNKDKVIRLHKLRQHLINTFPDVTNRKKWFNEPSENLYGEKGINGELPYVLFMKGDYEPLIHELTAIRTGSYVQEPGVRENYLKVWRTLPSEDEKGKKPNPFDNRYLYSSKTRWTREGAFQTLYTSLSKQTAIWEHIKQWSRRPIMKRKNYDLISFEAEIEPIVDLTHPRVRGKTGYNISKAEMTGDSENDIRTCKATAELIQAEYPALKTFSAALDGGHNLVIFNPTIKTERFELKDPTTCEFITFDLIKEHTMEA